jgi:hypothetical protein
MIEKHGARIHAAPPGLLSGSVPAAGNHLSVLITKAQAREVFFYGTRVTARVCCRNEAVYDVPADNQPRLLALEPEMEGP